MTQAIITAPYVKTEEIRTLFIELTIESPAKNSRYRDTNEKKDCISFDCVKETVLKLKDNMPEYISFVGSEPMIHPDFNKILRFCLEYASVIIYTNAGSINDKKARFLKKVEDENNKSNEIIFMIKIDEPNEAENDAVRGRGAFRKALHALQSLIKYDFNPILAITNRRKRPEKEIRRDFKALCDSFGFETSDINFKIMPEINPDSDIEKNNDFNAREFRGDCVTSRTLSTNGIFSCPQLTSDYRGKCGNKIDECEPRMYLETSCCTQCMKFGGKVYEFYADI